MKSNTKRSLGSLRLQDKTKPQSPEMIGTIKLRRELLLTFAEQMDDTDELTANLAAWKNHDGKNHYLTVELSPRYGTAQKFTRQEQTIFDVIEKHSRDQ